MGFLTQELVEQGLWEIDQIRAATRKLLLEGEITGFQANEDFAELDRRETKLKNTRGAQVGGLVVKRREKLQKSRSEHGAAHRKYQSGQMERYWRGAKGDNLAQGRTNK